MKDKIVNYLTVQILSDKTFEVHYAKRIRAAWLLAENKYKTLTEGEKRKIMEEIGTGDGT
jgi:hypothetical protein